MKSYLLPLVLVCAAGCGDGGPGPGEFDTTLWRLSSVNALPLPAPGNATGGEGWAAAVLQFHAGGTGFFDRCMAAPSTATRISRSTAVVVTSISNSKVALSYFDRRAHVPDTATVDGVQLTLRYTNQLSGQEGLDVLTFVPLDGLVPACNLAP